MLTTHEVVTSEALGETLAGIQWDVMLLDQVRILPLSTPIGTPTSLTSVSHGPPGSLPACGSLGRDLVRIRSGGLDGFVSAKALVGAGQRHFISITI